MIETDKIIIRDLRNGDWFWIHKEVMETYPKKVGAEGILIYNSLCYFANQTTSTCYPSLLKIEELTNLSHPTVCKYLKILEKHGLIKIENRQKEDKSNLYTLVKVVNKVVKEINKGSKGDEQGVVKEINTNNNKREQELSNKREREARHFTPPSLEEVLKYSEEKKLEIDAARFCDYYVSNGWRVGRVAMKDWKATARNWARTDKKRIDDDDPAVAISRARKRMREESNAIS